jgi:hypothetical protein
MSVAMAILRILPPAPRPRRIIGIMAAVFGLNMLLLVIQKIWICKSVPFWSKKLVSCRIWSAVSITELVSTFPSAVFSRRPTNTYGTISRPCIRCTLDWDPTAHALARQATAQSTASRSMRIRHWYPHDTRQHNPRCICIFQISAIDYCYSTHRGLSSIVSFPALINNPY